MGEIGRNRISSRFATEMNYELRWIDSHLNLLRGDCRYGAITMEPGSRSTNLQIRAYEHSFGFRPMPQVSSWRLTVVLINSIGAVSYSGFHILSKLFHGVSTQEFNGFGLWRRICMFAIRLRWFRIHWASVYVE